MNVATLHRNASPSSLRGLVTTPQRGLVEVATLASLYGVYELVRGQGHATLAAARTHTNAIVSLERDFHLYGEHAFQRAIHALPGLPTVLGVAYIVLHFVGTGAALVWIHRRHRGAFPLVRNTLIFSTAAALIVYVLFPVAPPRLAGRGFADTVTQGAHVNLSSDMLGSLYNPFAAVPSLHFGYALLVGVAVGVLARRRWARALGWAYPAVMLLTIVSTGNHFFFDAAAGGVVVAASYLVARWVTDAAPAAGWRGRAGSAVAPC
jgi:PAP2 superfamily